jgi:hypothetical protein
MKIDDLTLGQIKEINRLTGGASEKNLPFKVGEAYLFRTVTHIDVGRVKELIGDFAILEDASWIADTGRFHDCLKKGIFSEVEPYPNYAGVNTASLINFAPWEHELPKDQK